MTANPRTLDYPSVPSPSAPSLVAPRTEPLQLSLFRPDPLDWKIFPLTLLIIIALYALLQNRYWVPAGDSELYTAAARSLARGEGYRFNGQLVAITPPGWSLMMAG